MLIEQLNTTGEKYVTNDVRLSSEGILLFGTNTVGKTSIVRAIGIAVVLAQAGMFVPATKMEFYPFNQIFTRIIGNDNLFKGLSTFAVEMTELKMILQCAGARSLVLGDELCSGTETDSATSIFVAGLQHLYQERATFVFATHFHEVVGYEEVAEMSDRLFMKHLSVRYVGDGRLIYDRKLKDGAGDSMYGLEVCKSLQMPDAFLKRAYEIRSKYGCGGAGEKSPLEFKQSRYNSQKLVGKCEMCGTKMARETHHVVQQKYADPVTGWIAGIEGSNTSLHKDHISNLKALCEKCHDAIHSGNQ